MGRNATVRALLTALAVGGTIWAQTPDWRRVGSLVLDGGLASPSSGAVQRVWYTAEGALRIQAVSGAVFETADFETWKWIAAARVPAAALEVETGPANARVSRPAEAGSPIRYAIGSSVYRSPDEGRSWTDVTLAGGQSILGSPLIDLAVSPLDPEDVAVASGSGIWRSLDGGLSWAGLNEGLPNFPARRILSLSPVRVELAGGEAIWRPGQKTAWTPVAAEFSGRERALRSSLARQAGVAEFTAAAATGDFAYGGGADGRLWASPDRGGSWRTFPVTGGGSVEAVFVSPADPRAAVAVLSGAAEGRGPRVVRTANGGLFWDDITANLPPGAAHGVTADIASGTIYVATDGGVFSTTADLARFAPPSSWTKLAGDLPDARAFDVRLDEGGNQLFALFEGFGVYATLAPHRQIDPRVVNALDHSTRAAAPGSLLSLLGARASSARVGSFDAPVLAASGTESQIQVPFEVEGSSVALDVRTATGARSFVLPLQPVSPSIFLDRDGSPMILDADRGVLLDGSTPARAGSRIQILATGLGRVSPAWPTGLPAPAANPPKAVAPVRVFLDKTPIEVSRATLAPGYIGFYLVEAQIPDVVNPGPAELYIEAENQKSAAVSVTLVQ